MTKEMSPRGTLILITVILGLGIAMMVAMTWGFYRGFAPKFWDPWECQIESSEIEATEDGYQLSVEYSYWYDGTRHVSHRVRPWYMGHPDHSRSQALLEAYPEGARVVCYVDPGDPGEAALAWTVSWSLVALMLLPLVFIVGGVIGLGQWRRERSGRRRAPTYRGIWPTLAFFGFFFLVGAIYLTVEAILPTVEMVKAWWWEETPCTVLSSRTISLGTDSDDTPYYGPDILFQYQTPEGEFQSNRYGLMDSFSTDRSEMEELVALYPPGRETPCYFDPSEPQTAVLTRNFQWRVFAFALFSIPYLLIPVWAVRKYMDAKRR